MKKSAIIIFLFASSLAAQVQIGKNVQIGAGSSGVSIFAAPPADWPAWLVPTVINPTGATSLVVNASPIPNSALENTFITINSTACPLGGTCSISGAGVASINASTGPFTFTGSGVSCVTTTCTFSGGGAVTSVANSDGTLIVTPTTGPVIASLNLAHANTWTAPISVAVAGGQGGTVDETEGTAPSAAAGHDILYADAISHCIKYSANGGVFACLGSGGGLPTATQPGQIISSTAAGTTYGVQGQIFFSQSGDTIASIESECSSLCTYVVTTPQTFTLGSGHALSSNVQLSFQAGGQWTVNGAFTLTIPGNVSGTLNQHFAGSSTIAFGNAQAIVPVEWFGAIGYDSQSAAAAGADSTAAIQKSLSSLSAGQALLQTRFYRVIASLSITRSNVGIKGQGVTQVLNSALGVAAYPQSTLVSTSAANDVIDVAGTSSVYINANKFEDFMIQRNVIPSGTAAGMSWSFTVSAYARNVVSADSINDWYLHASASASVGGLYSCGATWGYSNVTETSGTFRGYFLDSADGNPENSIELHSVLASSNLSTTPITRGVEISGTNINDVDIFDMQTAGLSYGALVNYTGGGSGFIQTQDIHFITNTHDQCNVSCYLIENITAATRGSVSINGGYSSTASGATGISNIDIESSTGVSVYGVQVFTQGTSPAGIVTQHSSDILIANNTIQGATSAANDGIVLNITNGSSVTGNLIYNFDFGLVTGGSAANNVASGNVFDTNGAAGILLQAGALTNQFYPNAYNSTSTPYTDSSGNTSNVLNVTRTIASGTSALGTSAIASGACATVVTTTATGTASTDAISWNPNGSIKAVVGYVPSTSGGLTIAGYPTTNAVNWDVCNWTTSSITPGAVTLNWRVVR